MPACAEVAPRLSAPRLSAPRLSAPHSCRWRGLARPRATQLRRPRGRAPGSRGAGSRLAALPRKGGTTPRRGGTRPRCDLLPRPLRVAGPSSSSLTSSSGLHGSHTRQTRRVLPPRRPAGPLPRGAAAPSQRQVPKGPRGARSRDSGEETELRRRVRPWGADATCPGEDGAEPGRATPAAASSAPLSPNSPVPAASAPRGPRPRGTHA